LQQIRAGNSCFSRESNGIDVAQDSFQLAFQLISLLRDFGDTTLFRLRCWRTNTLEIYFGNASVTYIHQRVFVTPVLATAQKKTPLKKQCHGRCDVQHLIKYCETENHSKSQTIGRTGSIW